MGLSEEIERQLCEPLEKFGVKKLKSFQEKCIQRIMDDKKDVFCISKTGSGKSLCYQLPALLLDGYTVVISPLTALIDDQIRSLADKDISAVGFYHDSNKDNKEQQEALLNGQGDVKLIYTTPETLQSKSSFFRKLKISMLVIDEVHCVTVWGNDFRSAYRCIKSFLDQYSADERHPYRPIVAAFTATADSYIFNNAVNTLGMNVEAKDCIGTISRKWEFSKSSGKHDVFLYEKEAEQFRRVCGFLLRHPDDKCLVFCRTKEQMRAIYDLLESKLKSEHSDTSVLQKYYGGVSNKNVVKIKKYICEMFIEGKVKCVIATSAFGMGVDIPDIRFVIHVGFPFNMVDYIQQCGRGGRDGNGCEYKLYASLDDIEKTANMLMTKYLKMYPLSKCIKRREWDRNEYIKTVEYCLENTYHKEHKLKIPFRSKLDEYRDRDISEEYYVQHRSFQMLTNASADIKRRIRRREITFYESVLADGIYSLWYNDFESFTPRRLIACITGNPDLSFHNEKSKRVVALIDGLMADGIVPIEKHTENEKTKYYFTEQAKKCIPGTFRLHETALQKKRMCNIPDEVLRVMSDSADSKIYKKKLDEYEDITIIKYYLLRELERIFGYSHFHDIASKANGTESGSYIYRSIHEATSSKMIYSRYDRNARANYGRVTTNAEKQTGLFAMAEFKHTNEQIHKLVCFMLDNLKKSGYLRGYKKIYYNEEELKLAEKMDWDLVRDSDGRFIKGIDFRI